MAKIDTVTVFFNGEDLEVDFIYYKGFAGTREQPPEPPKIEIQAVRVEGEDVTDAVFDTEFEEIERLIEEKVAEIRRDWEEDQAYEKAADKAFWKELE